MGMDVKELYKIVQYAVEHKENLNSLEQAVLYKHLLSKEDKKDLKDYQEELKKYPMSTHINDISSSGLILGSDNVVTALITEGKNIENFYITEENIASLIEAAMIFSGSITGVLEKTKKYMSISTEEYSGKLKKFTNTLSIDKTRDHLFSFLRYSSWDKEVCKEIMEFFNNSQGAELFPEALRKYKIIDKRCFIPYMDGDTSMCLVVSLNPYDVLWCSSGSEFSSCYSLSSDYSGFEKNLYSFRHGDRWKCYMLYTTEYSTSKYKLFSDTKSPCPYMKQRAWGWLSSSGEICVDKEYGEIPRDTLSLYEVCKAVSQVFTRSERKLDEDFTSVYLKDLVRSYPDSLQFYCYDDILIDEEYNGEEVFNDCNEIYFDFDSGYKSFLKDSFQCDYAGKMVTKKLLESSLGFDLVINEYGEACETTSVGQVYPKYLEEFFKDAKEGELIVPLLYLGDYDTLMVFDKRRYSEYNSLVHYVSIDTDYGFSLEKEDYLVNRSLSKKLLAASSLTSQRAVGINGVTSLTVKIKKVYGKQVSFKNISYKKGEG